MKFVPESVIDTIVEALENTPEDAEDILLALNERQPALAPFVLSNNEGSFDEGEEDFLLYLLLVIWKSHEQVNGRQPPIAPEALEAAEENNWELLEQLPPTAKKFRERLDVLFAASAQEDLLAFVEDALLGDEDGDDLPITREGREPIFIIMKTVVDCLG